MVTLVAFGTIGQLYKTTSFLVVSASFHSEMRKSVGNTEETTSLLFFFHYNKREIRVKNVLCTLGSDVPGHEVDTERPDTL